MKLPTLLGAIACLASMATPAIGDVQLASSVGNQVTCQWSKGTYLGAPTYVIYIKAGGPFVGTGPTDTTPGLQSLLQRVRNECAWALLTTGRGVFELSGAGPYIVRYVLASGFPRKCSENAIWLATNSTSEGPTGLTCLLKANPSHF